MELPHPTLICWVIYVALGAHGFPWPAIVTVATGMQFLRLTTSREDSIQSIEHDLEKKERKRLEAKRTNELGQEPPVEDDTPGGT